MFEDQDLKKDSQDNSLNNKLVQENNSSNQEGMSYQEKLKDNKITEDIFEGSDDSSLESERVINPNNFNNKEGGISPLKPLTNYQDLVEESKELQGDKVKPRYFIIGLLVILVIVGWGGWWIYQQFFTGTRESGEIILDTESKEIILDKNDKNEIENENVEPGINVNSSAISIDIDGDGLSNEEEIILGTALDNADTDGDGLSDREEVKIYHTDPLHEDTDLDTYLDGEEVENGYNPLGSGKLFDFSLITGTEDLAGSVTEDVTIKELVEPNIDIKEWSSFSNDVFRLGFQYPFDWSIKEEENKIIINPVDVKNTDYVEIDIRENLLELDLVDWFNTQVDYPDFKQDQLKINDKIALVVHSDDPNWKALSSIFISVNRRVYNFNFFSDYNNSDNFDIFQMIVLQSDFSI